MDAGRSEAREVRGSNSIINRRNEVGEAE